MPNDSEPTAKNGTAGENGQGVIRVRGAATHNLRSVDLDLPRGKLTVFCGVSGSGKTSMAIDTLYAEGQRRYIESFSAYTRQFLERLDKPDVEHIDGLPPAIAITQRAASRSNRATVATATEIADHLRVLFARLGEVVCPECNQTIRRDSADSVAERVGELPSDRRLMIAFPAASPAEGESWADWAATLVEAGFVRAVIGGQTVALGEVFGPPRNEGDRNLIEPLVIVDRLKTGDLDADRLRESIETALISGDDACALLVELPDGEEVIDGRPWAIERFSTRLRCDACDRDFTPPEPRLFDFNNPLGACPECEGFGSVVETDMNLIVPDRTKSIREGAIAPWNTPAYAHELEELLALASDYGIPVDCPFYELTDEHLNHIVHGVPERDFGGIDGFIAWLERRKYKMHLRVFLSRWRSYRDCPACGGARLGPDAMAVQIDGKTFADVMAMDVLEAKGFLEGGRGNAEGGTQANGAFRLPPSAFPLQEPILARLEYLRLVGLAYLTLDRSMRSLSAGEARRVAMTSLLGSNLVDLLYVLDEPSVGLHPADVDALAGAIGRLRDRGATVVVVEHEESILRSADHVVEFGPAAGAEGGEIVFSGTPAELVAADNSRTGDWLANRRAMTTGRRRTPSHDPLRLRGARGANLRGADGSGVDVDFPVGVLTVVTGVSGAGKTSLVLRTLVPAVQAALAEDGTGKAESGNASDDELDSSDASTRLPYSGLLGAGAFDAVQLIDRQPVARSQRSNPVTYVKAFDAIRAVFAETADAKTRGFKAKHFSFNVDGGRCEACSGAGYTVVDMQFLADVAVLCDECQGRRYRREVLEVKHRGRDIAEVLDMTVLDAFRFFRGEQKVQARLRPLLDVGLGYLPLGQSTSTLSGGESQRLKLAGALATRSSKTTTCGRTLFVLDEPTTGLHFSDIPPLLDCFDALVDIGHTVVVIEHNVQLMMAADWLIDLGPGAADEGGLVVASGTPEEVAKCEASATGRVLAEAFRREAAALAEIEDEE